MGASDASLPGKTATGWSAVTSDPVKSALKSPVSRLSTSKACSVAVPAGALREPAGERAAGDHARVRLHLRRACCRGSPRSARKARRSMPKFVDGSDVIAIVCGQAGTTYARPTPLLSPENGQELRGVVREDVDVVERVELVGDDGKVARDLVGVPRQRRACAGVERPVGGAVDLARAEVEHLEVLRRDDRASRRPVVACDASPGLESSCSTVTCAATSGCTFETTMAYCCAAAFSDGETSALSRSAPQYSQPTFDCSGDAWSQSCTHAPLRHA